MSVAVTRSVRTEQDVNFCQQVQCARLHMLQHVDDFTERSVSASLRLCVELVD